MTEPNTMKPLVPKAHEEKVQQRAALSKQTSQNNHVRSTLQSILMMSPDPEPGSRFHLNKCIWTQKGVKTSCVVNRNIVSLSDANDRASQRANVVNVCSFST